MLTLKAYQATICTKSVDPRVNNLDLVCGKTYIHADRQTDRQAERQGVSRYITVNTLWRSAAVQNVIS